MLASLKFVERFVTLPRVKSKVEGVAAPFDRYDFDSRVLAPLLTRQGFEVESVAVVGEAFDRVVVGRIERAEPHPKADKLQVCQVNTGKETRQIVCGARNARVGLFVAAALPGAVLPGKAGGAPLEIKGAMLRDVESNGMLCSREELGLPVDVAVDGDGIWELHSDAGCGAPEEALAQMLGVPVFDALGLRDTLLELNVTPNRPDMLCHEGVARELLAGLTFAGIPAQWKSHGFAGKAPVAEAAMVAESCTKDSANVAGVTFSVDNALGVAAFFGALEGVTVAPSPGWLRAQLESLGQKSINNVVDASNYVLLAFGQPSHAFDVATIAARADGSKGLALRPAKEGEAFLALDGKERALVDTDCVVADAVEPQALLGVIGGERSKVTNSTTAVVLEFANPHPVAVRRSSRRHGRRTDSSFAFEKGIDVADRFRAACELVGLLVATTPAGAPAPRWKGAFGSRLLAERPAAAHSFVDDPSMKANFGPLADRAHPLAVDASVTAVRPAGEAFSTPAWAAWREARVARYVCTYSGTDLERLVGASLVPFETELAILGALGFDVEKDPAAAAHGTVRVVVPHWRWLDVAGVPDLVEEVVRVVGIDKVPSALLPVMATLAKDDAHLKTFEALAARAAALGYNEIAGYHFARADDLARLRLPGAGALGEPLALMNPIIRDQPLMHTTLIPNLLRCAQRNGSFGVGRGMLFHVTRTYVNLDAAGQRVFPANGTDLGLADACRAGQPGGGDALAVALADYAPQRAFPYSREASQAGRPAETPRLAGVSFGPRDEKEWFNGGLGGWTLHEIAAHALELGTAVGVSLRVVPLPAAHPMAPALHPGRRAAVVTASGEPAGWVGEVHPAALRAYEVNVPVFAFELNAAVLHRETQAPGATQRRVVVPLRFPAVSRDFAFLLSDAVSAGALGACVRRALTGSAEDSVRSLQGVPARLVDVRVFDVYRGKGVRDGSKSVAFNVTVEPLERTLTDKDIQWLANAVVQAVTRELEGELRGG